MNQSSGSVFNLLFVSLFILEPNQDTKEIEISSRHQFDSQGAFSSSDRRYLTCAVSTTSQVFANHQPTDLELELSVKYNCIPSEETVHLDII